MSCLNELTMKGMRSAWRYPYRVDQVKMDNPSDILCCTVGKIVARKYYCPFCYDLVKSALGVAKLGPEKFLQHIVGHQGMICGSVEWMMEEARKALDTISVKDGGQNL